MDDSFTIKLLEWDSAFFNKRIGQLNIEQNATVIKNANDFDLIQAKVLTTNYHKIDLLNQLNFNLVEGELDFSLNISSAKYDENLLTIQLATPSDIQQIKTVVDNSFNASRYRKPWFSEPQRNQFYQLWAEKAVQGTFDDLCILIKDNKNIKGFVTLKLSGNTARIGLICVNSNFHGQGVATTLLKQAVMYSQNKNCEQVYVTTQLANSSAIALYTKFGFTINTISYWFYKT
ncbi:MAG: dTDP-4-amino-4,6-dideoxy-D-galactose acyltransferase [Gammaproteobacteria bacterium]|nr:MAG: dTDP-4-amino-4,6-dideoxy-D-galactose acyltransferase [Gammaproteobacteria bacterium]